MERFYNDNPDENHFFGSNDDDDDQIEEPTPELEAEAVAFMDQEGILTAMQMDLAQAELNQHLLTRAIEIASKNWFWRFKGLGTKLYEIEIVYRRLSRIVGED